MGRMKAKIIGGMRVKVILALAQALICTGFGIYQVEKMVKAAEDAIFLQNALSAKVPTPISLGQIDTETLANLVISYQMVSKTSSNNGMSPRARGSLALGLLVPPWLIVGFLCERSLRRQRNTE